MHPFKYIKLLSAKSICSQQSMRCKPIYCYNSCINFVNTFVQGSLNDYSTIMSYWFSVCSESITIPLSLVVVIANAVLCSLLAVSALVT